MAIKPEEVVRDKYGFWTHSQFPDFGEYITDEAWSKWCAENQIKGVFVEFESDAPEELQDEWFDGGNDCSKWQPTKPAEYSFLLSVHATEDGPVAIFAIPLIKPMQGEHTVWGWYPPAGKEWKL